MRPVTDPPVTTVSLADHLALMGLVKVLQANVAALTARLDAFQADRSGRGDTRGARDAAERRVIEALAQICGDAEFGHNDVTERGRLDPAFGDLLLAADLVTAPDVGYFLRRVAKASGARLRRCGKDANGARWVFLS